MINDYLSQQAKAGESLNDHLQASASAIASVDARVAQLQESNRAQSAALITRISDMQAKLNTSSRNSSVAVAFGLVTVSGMLAGMLGTLGWAAKHQSRQKAIIEKQNRMLDFLGIADEPAPPTPALIEPIPQLPRKKKQMLK
eukprot:GHVT01098157.1.p1 GENE.GHVT01098157.1~~GHVT01098157.1.p1  ORF type:complete len:142 (-),score=22.03 GHVT01098157.1:374-799(-)